jgi:hypothetical protein
MKECQPERMLRWPGAVMKKPTDLTVEILRKIHAEAAKTNERLEETNRSVQETNERLEALRAVTETGMARLEKRLIESEIRTATAVTELTGTVRELTGVLRAQHDVRPRLEKCEQDIAELQRRLAHAS